MNQHQGPKCHPLRFEVSTIPLRCEPAGQPEGLVKLAGVFRTAGGAHGGCVWNVDRGSDRDTVKAENV